MPTLTYKNRPFTPRGINLGSWLNIEDFMIGLQGTDWQIRKAIERQLGAETASAFFQSYRDNYITGADITRIAELGFNCVRLPFNWHYFETSQAPFDYTEAAFAPIDRLFEWCGRHGLAVLLDFHAAPGGQNTTPPSDSTTGYSQLWESAHYQDRTVALWEALARRYARHPALLGYNLLNEPQTNQHGELDPDEQVAAMNALYHRLLRALRSIDTQGWIVISGPVRTSGPLDQLDRTLFEDPRTAVSYHHYPLASYEQGINFESAQAEHADVDTWYRFLEKQTAEELAYVESIDRPMILGEFGWSSKWDSEQAECALAAQIRLHEDRGWGWMIWAYKDLNTLGLFQPRADTAWVRFTQNPCWQTKLETCRAAFAETFDRAYIGSLGKDSNNAHIYDAAWGDGLRGLKRILLEYQIRCLADYPAAAIEAMPECFRLDNCRLREDFLAVLQPYLKSAPTLGHSSDANHKTS